MISTMAMRNFIKYMLLIFPTQGPDPDVMIELLPDSQVRVKINEQYTIHRLNSNLEWPATLSVGYTGAVDLQLPKTVMNSDFGLQLDVSEDMVISSAKETASGFPATILLNNKLNENTHLISFNFIEPIFIFFNMGSYMTIRMLSNTDGQTLKEKVFTSAVFPILTIINPNRGRNMTRLATHPISFLIRCKANNESDSFCKKKKGDIIDVDYPKQTFKSTFLNGMKNIFLIVSNMGIGSAMTIAFHVLQNIYVRDAKVVLLAFHKTEKDMFWISDLKYLRFLEERFIIEHFVDNQILELNSDATKGKPTEFVMKNLIRKYQNNNTGLDCFCLIGKRYFVNNVHRFVKDGSSYKENQFYKIMM